MIGLPDIASAEAPLTSGPDVTPQGLLEVAPSRSNAAGELGGWAGEVAKARSQADVALATHLRPEKRPLPGKCT